ncbi:MAG: molybdopterin cofactor-binding domain-containing protein [Acidimicrobiales bacterium]
MLRHIAVDDAGTVVNPVVFEGQQQSGIAQGASQALYEEVAYDADGNPITANFMNYVSLRPPSSPASRLRTR